MKQLPANASVAEIKAALKTANAEHVSAGKREGVDYKNTMPPGEDRDADGKIDPRPQRGDRGRGGPPPQKNR